MHITYVHTQVPESSVCCNRFLFNTLWCLSYVPISKRPYTSNQVFTARTLDFPSSCQSYTSYVRPVIFSPHARLPCILLSFVTFHFTPLMSQLHCQPHALRLQPASKQLQTATIGESAYPRLSASREQELSGQKRALGVSHALFNMFQGCYCRIAKGIS